MKFLALGALVALAVLCACGAPQARQSGATRAGRLFEEHLASSDYRAACELLAPEGREQLEEDEKRPCEQALPSQGLARAGVREAWKSTAGRRCSGCATRPSFSRSSTRGGASQPRDARRVNTNSAWATTRERTRLGGPVRRTGAKPSTPGRWASPWPRSSCCPGLAQSISGVAAFNELRLRQLQSPVTWQSYLASADFWNRSLQNWQPELLAVAAMAILSSTCVSVAYPSPSPSVPRTTPPASKAETAPGRRTPSGVRLPRPTGGIRRTIHNGPPASVAVGATNTKRGERQ